MPDRETRPEPRFSVVVPCFNEQGAIVKTVSDLRTVLAGAGAYELIVVDDGSTDETPARLAELAAQDRALVPLRMPRNQGYGAALKAGIRRAASERIVITDADGTYPNERIPELLTRMDHFDMVVGARIASDVTYPLIRRIPKVFLRSYASWIAGQDIVDINSGLRVFRKDLAERYFHILPDGFSFTTTITLAFLTNRYAVDYVPIGYAARVGKSKIKPIRDTLKFFQLILRTGMYFAPLRVFSPLILLLLFGFLASLTYDVLWLDDLTDKTVILLMFAMNTGFFALLADMIDKRTSG